MKRFPILSSLVALIILLFPTDAFNLLPITAKGQFKSKTIPFKLGLGAAQRKDGYDNGYDDGGVNDNDNDNDNDNITLLRNQLIHKEIIDRMINGSNGNGTSGSNRATEMTLIGQGKIGPVDDPISQSTCLFLSTTSTTTTAATTSATSYSSRNNNNNDNQPPKEENIICIPIPLPSPTSTSKSLIKLLSFAYKNQPISKSLCLALSPLLINRDGSLYDNLPWNIWSIDPLNKNKDAAGNIIEKKYHLGKRDAYNRFMGKDWYGRSLSIGNLAARAKYMLENDDDDDDEKYNHNHNANDDNQNEEDEQNVEKVTMDEEAAKILAKRVLEIEIKESKMAKAEAEEQLAILRNKLGSQNVEFMEDEMLIQNYDALQNGIQAVTNAQSSLEENENALSELEKEVAVVDASESNSLESTNSALVNLFSAIIDTQKSEAPYRGAIGYKPTIDTKDEMYNKSILPYSSPYELMNEIINEQLNAHVIGCIIENTSLFNGSIVLGGALVLQRQNVKKEIVIDGESLVMNDSDDDLGNDGIKGGEVIIVECDCDEAIGMAITCGLNLSLESNIWDQCQVMCTLSNEQIEGNESIMDILPVVEMNDKSIILKTQGDGEVSEGIPIQVPRNTNDAFGNFFAPSENQPVFNTDNPIQSLQEYDELTIQDKAQLLSSLESFKGRLPRPRALREIINNRESSSSNSSYNEDFTPLDEMLIPLIDESVRRQILIREATKRGDTNMANNLKNDKSMRQMAKEKAQQAKEEGNEDLAAMWETESDFYESLRADVTQDEGTYSSFLDRDEWYERNRRANVERNKKRFGSLFNDNDLE